MGRFTVVHDELLAILGCLRAKERQVLKVSMQRLGKLGSFRSWIRIRLHLPLELVEERPRARKPRHSTARCMDPQQFRIRKREVGVSGLEGHLTVTGEPVVFWRENRGDPVAIWNVLLSVSRRPLKFSICACTTHPHGLEPELKRVEVVA